MVLGDRAIATCAQISMDALRVATAAHTLYLSRCAAVQNLVYGCGNVPQTTAESSDIPLIHSAQHVQQSVVMSIQLPAGL